VKAWNRNKKDFYKGFYKSRHGLHVVDNKYVPGCKACAERAKLIVLARINGWDEEETLKHGIYDHEKKWSPDP
jgi:hypothetical protein